MVVDVIILSYVKDDSILKMNEDCMKSLYNSTDQHKFQIYLIETNKEKEFKYEGCDTCEVIQPDCEFNYNKFLNIGLEHCKNDWVLISNNDTIYHKNFLEEMMVAHNYDNQILSMSPMDDDWHRHQTFDKKSDIYYGYRTSYEVAGWSILVHRSVIQKIGGFDEQFTFWYQDNDYAHSLMKNNIKHALITKSKVTHLLSKSHGFLEGRKKYEMTDGLGHVFMNKWMKR
jgi:cellulose synthase/poly-beta-1,6-N-acetylglucosamine synthase-like glycosyltransferase